MREAVHSGMERTFRHSAGGRLALISPVAATSDYFEEVWVAIIHPSTFAGQLAFVV